MSSTRHAKDDSFHQSRYASSPEFERGLRASLVAQRCFLIDAPSDRELIWFIQYLSHQEGGLAAIARAIIEKYAGRIQTKTMASMGLRPGTICNADQVRKLRADFDIIEGDISPSQSFILKGEEHVSGMRPPVPLSPQLSDFESQSHYEDRRQESEQYPTSYPSEKIFGVCSDAAGAHFEKWLNEVCLDPGTPFSHGPWYFHEAIEVLREFKNDYEKNISAGAVVTALGQIVCEALDYTAYSHGLTLLQGEARTGKSHAGRTWCNQHPGRARFVEVPPGNDETGFFRALARGLGLGNFLNYKTTEILARLEPVLLTGDILLVLDEA